MMITEMKVRGDRGIEYTISASIAGLECTCPDHVFRARDCKHIKFARETVAGSRPQAAAGPSLVSVPSGN